MTDSWYLRTQDETFGPETRQHLLEWAQMGRIQPGQEISMDGENWMPATEVDFLDMRWSIDIGDGLPRGPFNKVAAQALLDSGRLPRGSKLVEVRPKPGTEPRAEPEPETPPAPAPVRAAPSAAAPQVIEKIVEKRVEVPVEKIVEKRVEVPVEKIVEKRVEVPVEKIVEKRVEVQDPALLARLNEMTAAEREAQARAAAAQDAAAAAAREAREKVAATEREAREKVAATEREAQKKLAAAEREAAEQVAEARRKAEEAEAETLVLSDEIKRLPPNAQAAADMEAAVYALLRDEAEALARTLELEKREAEEAQRRWQARAERLQARRQELLRRIGTSADDMKRRALREHPEDPRTMNLRRELDALRVLNEKTARETDLRIRELTARLREKTAEADRLRLKADDTAVLTRQIQELRERLQIREKELLDERQHAEKERQQQTASQQALLTRLSALESSLPENSDQAREARAVKLAPWMGLKH